MGRGEGAYFRRDLEHFLSTIHSSVFDLAYLRDLEKCC